MKTRDAGNAIIEFALWLPIVLVSLATCLQLMTGLYDARAADDAARVALRAQESGADPEQAARAALGGRDAIVTADGDTVHVVMPVRQFLPWLPAAARSVHGDAGGDS
jgi:Flp pilus assembly protein TadG